MNKIQQFTLYYLRLISTLFRRSTRQRGLLLRGVLAWLVGCLILINDEVSSFDTRLQIRGNQKSVEDIILITFTQADMLKLYSNQNLLALHEASEISDSYYWNEELWYRLLSKLLLNHPKIIGVTLFLGDSAILNEIPSAHKETFYNQKLIWAAMPSQEEKVLYSVFANKDHSNIGIIDIFRDQDGVIRSFPPSYRKIDRKNKLMIEQMYKLSLKKSNAFSFINYRGDQNVFTQISVSDFLNDTNSAQRIQNKIVIIGSEPITSSQYLTPFGPSTRQAVIASQVDHIMNNRSISHIHFVWYALFLGLLTIMVIFVMSQYPQSVAFVILVWTSTLWTALSIWVFDSLYFWIPIGSAIVTMASTYFLLLGYQTNKIERKHYQLQQEQKYLQALEQLKNNFVSLISHDLKTPIAKIQAILDRLIIRENSQELNQDFKSLRQCSEELNRYIQSVLQMLRVESRDFKLHIEVADLNEIIQNAYNQLVPLAREKNIFIKMNLEPLFSSDFDQTLIQEVMINLIENAIKYTNPGGEIFITSSEESGKIHVCVQDNGEGISDVDLENVWGKFVRGKNQDLKTKGSGLGLYLVKFFIELHGGEVWLESKMGVGTKANFTLPVEQKSVGAEI